MGQIGQFGQDGVGVLRHVFHGFGPLTALQQGVASSHPQRNNYALWRLMAHESVPVADCLTRISISVRRG